jgi:DMSO reductase family type II enzyme chaperone
LYVFPASRPVAVNAPRHILQGRQAADTAPLRCLGYAACSELLASPHDVDPRPALQERFGLGSKWPPGSGLDPLLAEVGNASLEALRGEYSALFEVGDDGPPVPIRAQLSDDVRTGAREEVVRYYEHFGYALGEKFAWQPDHLSVELEFMHFLCFRECQAATPADALPFQLAQSDFCERHLAPWLPALASRAQQVAPDSLYSRVVRAVADYVADDGAWQLSTIRESPAR